MGSENKLQRQKTGPWSLGERKVKVTHLEGRKEGEEMCGLAHRRRMSWVFLLRAFKGGNFKGGLRGGYE